MHTYNTDPSNKQLIHSVCPGTGPGSLVFPVAGSRQCALQASSPTSVAGPQSTSLRGEDRSSDWPYTLGLAGIWPLDILISSCHRETHVCKCVS